MSKSAVPAHQREDSHSPEASGGDTLGFLQADLQCNWLPFLDETGFLTSLLILCATIFQTRKGRMDWGFLPSERINNLICTYKITEKSLTLCVFEFHFISTDFLSVQIKTGIIIT